MSEIFFSEKERSLKTFILIVTDIIMIMSSYWISMWLRLDRETPIYSLLHWSAISFTIPCTLFIFVKIGFYRAILRYVNMSILKWVLIGSFLSTLILIAFSLYQQTFFAKNYSNYLFLFPCYSVMWHPIYLSSH